MNTSSSQTDKQALFEKRQQLFSLWQTRDPEPPAATTASGSRAPAAPAPAPVKEPPDEVRDMLQKFANPNADRLTLF